MDARLQKIYDGDVTLFKEGDPVKYTYIHAFNSKNVNQVTKFGVFVRYVNSQLMPYGTYSKVKFEGNKNLSEVPTIKLKLDIRRIDGEFEWYEEG